MGPENSLQVPFAIHDVGTLVGYVLAACASVNKMVGKESFQMHFADGYSSLILFNLRRVLWCPIHSEELIELLFHEAAASLLLHNSIQCLRAEKCSDSRNAGSLSGTTKAGTGIPHFSGMSSPC